MTTKKFQTFTRPFGSSDEAEGKIVLEDFDVESLRKSMNDIWKSHTNLTHPGKYFRPSKVKIMRPTSPK